MNRMSLNVHKYVNEVNNEIGSNEWIIFWIDTKWKCRTIKIID